MHEYDMQRLQDVVYPLNTPLFLREMKQINKEFGPMAAIKGSFEQASIIVDPDDSPEITENGLLLFGDHKNTAEKWPLMAWVGSNTDKDCSFLSKPFSLQARLLHSLGGGATKLTLPVIPTNPATQKENIYNTYLSRKIVARSELSSTDKLKEMNRASIMRAVEVLANGEALTTP